MNVKENLEEWLKNPSWKMYYDAAPSEMCRTYIALDFYASETEDEEAFKAMDALLGKLSEDDLRYLMENAEGPERAVFARALNQ